METNLKVDHRVVLKAALNQTQGHKVEPSVVPVEWGIKARVLVVGHKAVHKAAHKAALKAGHKVVAWAEVKVCKVVIKAVAEAPVQATLDVAAIPVRPVDKVECNSLSNLQTILAGIKSLSLVIHTRLNDLYT